MTRKAKFRKVRGAVRKAYKVYLVWLSTDSDYDVPIPKSTALDFINMLESSGDRINVLVGSVGQVYLDRASCCDCDEEWEPIQHIDNN
jgi:hypothetical protein